MHRIKLCAVAALVLWLAPLALTQSEPVPSESDLAAITARGRLLYEYDQAAWHSSDAVTATKPQKETLGRYIAHKTDNQWVVAFGHLNETRDAFVITVLAKEGKNPQEYSVTKFDSGQSDTGFFLAAARAIEIALQDFHGPARPYNVAVLPAQEGKLFVYLVPAQTQDGVYPLGADVRYLFSPDGSAIIEKRQLHKGMIPTGGPVPPGATIVGGTHSHVLSDVPEDTDVFLVLIRKPSMPEFIATQIAIYEVNPDGTIKVVQRVKKQH